MRINTNTLYFTDNGRVVCGSHLGYTAKASGRDISGQKIAAVSPSDVREAKSDGWIIACEDCGKAASCLHVA